MSKNERLIPRRSSESRNIVDRVQTVLDLTSRLNLLPFSDTQARIDLLSEILGGPLPPGVRIYPPFYCDHGLNIELGEGVFINQNCSLYDIGGIKIGDRTMIGPGVTLATAGHPVTLSERYDGITTAPIVIENDVWIGANVTVAPGVTIGHGSVIGAGTVVAKNVPAQSVVTANDYVKR